MLGVIYSQFIRPGDVQVVNPKVRIAVLFVESNFHRDIYVAEITDLVRLSRSRFSDLFKSELGKPFIQYLKKARMEKARKLLETTFEPIKSIAVNVGYSDPSHFERYFKESYDLTPSQYRNKYLARRVNKEESKEKK